MIKEFLLEYMPYIVIGFNALMSCLTYKRTGKVTKTTKTGRQVVDEDLQAMIDYHKSAIVELESVIKGGDNNGNV